jgi:filamentous hemagglutinin
MLKPGQRGIIYGKINSNGIAHVFNVYNEKGIIKFIDGQTGKRADLICDNYKFLPTNFKLN